MDIIDVSPVERNLRLCFGKINRGHITYKLIDEVEACEGGTFGDSNGTCSNCECNAYLSVVSR